MKLSYLKILILIFLPILILGCNVDDDDGTGDTLPPVTTQGASTFGCKINGQVFLPKMESCFLCGRTEKMRLSYFQSGDTYQLGINAYNDINGDVSMHLDLYLDEPLAVGVYELSESYIASIDRTWPNAAININRKINNEIINSSFGTNSEMTGTLEILEYNITERFIAGVFEFQAINQQGKIVEISEGRFDMRIH